MDERVLGCRFRHLRALSAGSIRTDGELGLTRGECWLVLFQRRCKETEGEEEERSNGIRFFFFKVCGPSSFFLR